MMSNEKQMVVISGFMGFAIGTMLMMIVNLNDEVTYNERIHDWWMEYEYLEENVCEDCYNNHFNQE